MARIKLEMPQNFVFQTEIPIRINDINYGNHLGNDSILSIIHEARIQFLTYYHCSELDIHGASLIMGDVAIVFRSEGFYGDTLIAKVTPYDFTSLAFDIYYLLISKKTGKTIAESKTSMVCFDYAIHKVVPIPDIFRKNFE